MWLNKIKQTSASTDVTVIIITITTNIMICGSSRRSSKSGISRSSSSNKRGSSSRVIVAEVEGTDGIKISDTIQDTVMNISPWRGHWGTPVCQSGVVYE